EASPIPVLRRVVVGLNGGRLEWGETLEEALSLLFGSKVLPTAEIESSKEEVTATKKLPSANLTKQALDHYNQAQKYLRSGEWAKFGEEWDKLKQTLEMLQKE
ncbi:MAG: hypothetical protein ACPL7B_10665, partial [Candidatus Poribacteria bacterium]